MDGAGSVISLEPKRSLASGGHLQRTQAGCKVNPLGGSQVRETDLLPLAPVLCSCPLPRPWHQFLESPTPAHLTGSHSCGTSCCRPGGLSSQRPRVTPMGCTKGNGQDGASSSWGSKGDFLKGPSRGPSTFRCVAHISHRNRNVMIPHLLGLSCGHFYIVPVPIPHISLHISRLWTQLIHKTLV